MSVTTPRGFLASGITAGLKTSGRPDLALVVNTGPQFSAAGVFTTNRFTAAPVQWSRQAIADAQLRAVVLNSGGANACTGDAGRRDAARMAELVATELGCTPTEVGVCSTGLIGVQLPMDLLETAIPAAANSLTSTGGPDAAQAIMTTDTVPKQAEHLDPAGWRIGIQPTCRAGCREAAVHE